MADMPPEIWALQDPHEKVPFGLWSGESDCDDDTRYVRGDRYAAAIAALRHALPLVEKWCYSQGDMDSFHARPFLDETLAPIRCAIADSEENQ